MNLIIEINKQESVALLHQKETILLDVRETEEFEEFNIGGLNIPSHLLSKNYDSLSKNKNIIVVCSNGLRSSIIAKVLLKKIPTSQIYHMTNGVEG